VLFVAGAPGVQVHAAGSFQLNGPVPFGAQLSARAAGAAMKQRSAIEKAMMLHLKSPVSDLEREDGRSGY
jgi:hypothetical protein